MLDSLSQPYVQRALIELALLSIAGGLLGTWIVLRGLAFFSHAVGTAAFPGLVLAEGLGFAAPLGGFAAAAAFSLAVAGLATRRRTGYDSLTALVLVGCLALGVVLASDVFHSGSGIDTLLFGSLLLIDGGDIALAAGASVLAIAGSLLLGKRWLATGFDPGGAHALGVRSAAPELALLLLVAFATTAALTATGALLTTAIFVVPAATTRLFARRMPGWQVATVALLAVEGFAGVLLADATNTPPGAAIAVVSGGVFAVAAVVRLAPRRAIAAGAAAAALALVGCGASGEGSGGGLEVVATTTQAADFVREVGGREVSVTQIIQPNTDAHDYEPRPADVKATARAEARLHERRRSRRLDEGRRRGLGRVARRRGSRQVAPGAPARRPALVARPAQRRGGRRGDPGGAARARSPPSAPPSPATRRRTWPSCASSTRASSAASPPCRGESASS